MTQDGSSLSLASPAGRRLETALLLRDEPNGSERCERCNGAWRVGGRFEKHAKDEDQAGYVEAAQQLAERKQ
jgi:hypothetical protein